MVHDATNGVRKSKVKSIHRLLTGLLVLVMLLSASGLNFWSTTAQEADQSVPSGDVIVVLEEEPAAPISVAEATAEAEAAEVGVEPTHTYTEVFNGFAANVSPEQAEELASDPNV